MSLKDKPLAEAPCGVLPRGNDSLLSRFAALCFFLSTIEYLIPKPLPFLRLGLANVPLILALSFFSFKDYFLLLLLKVLGQALLTGSLFSYIFLFSFTGTLSSGLFMFLLYTLLKTNISSIGLSVAGAFISNGTQIILARFFIFGFSAWYIAPVFFLTGILTSIGLGVFTNLFLEKSRWLASFKENRDQLNRAGSDPRLELKHTQDFSSGFASNSMPDLTFNRGQKLRWFLGFVLILMLTISTNTAIRISIVCLGLFLNILDKSKISFIPIIVTSISIIFFNLLIPAGKVLFLFFTFPITQGSLFTGIHKALLLEGLFFLSRWILYCPISFPGRIGTLISNSLTIFSKLTKKKSRIKKDKGLFYAIDSLMFELD